jgi:hypothetical protein
VASKHALDKQVLPPFDDCHAMLDIETEWTPSNAEIERFERLFMRMAHSGQGQVALVRNVRLAATF